MLVFFNFFFFRFCKLKGCVLLSDEIMQECCENYKCNNKLIASCVYEMAVLFPEMLVFEGKNTIQFLKILNQRPMAVAAQLNSNDCKLKYDLCIDKVFFNKGIKNTSGIICQQCKSNIPLHMQMYFCNYRYCKFYFFFFYFFFFNFILFFVIFLTQKNKKQI